MVILTTAMFASAATGLASAFALIRGLISRDGRLGNFFNDFIRSITRVLLPVAFLVALIFVACGDQTLGHAGREDYHRCGAVHSLGPVASLESIKFFGTNGGGYYGTNSAHPFENPSSVTNLMQNILTMLLPFAIPYAFGVMAGNRRQGVVILAVMVIIFLSGALILVAGEASNPALPLSYPTGYFEGKEQRFTAYESAFFIAVDTFVQSGAPMRHHVHDAASCTPRHVRHDDAVYTWRRGVRVRCDDRLCLAVRVYRRPHGGEDAGVPWQEDRAAGDEADRSRDHDPSGHGSATDRTNRHPVPARRPEPGRPGVRRDSMSSFRPRPTMDRAWQGLQTPRLTPTSSVGLIIAVGRYVPLVAMIAIAGLLSKKKMIETTRGTLPTDNLTFALFLLGIILIVGAITFLPALTFRPAGGTVRGPATWRKSVMDVRPDSRRLHEGFHGQVRPPPHS